LYICYFCAPILTALALKLKIVRLAQDIDHFFQFVAAKTGNIFFHSRKILKQFLFAKVR
jgi:hypothetical protein